MPDSTDHVAVMITFTTPAENASDDAFNDWYDNTHVPEILKHVDGVESVRRYRLSEAQPPQPGTTPAPYVAVYDLSRPPADVLASLGAASGKMTMSETLGAGDRGPVTLFYELHSGS